MLSIHRCGICETSLKLLDGSPCQACRKSLIPCAPLPPRPPFQALRARWLFAGTGYRLFLEWKKRPTRTLQRFLLDDPKIDLEDRIWTRQHGNILIPIPQNFERAWQLGHSPATVLASRLSQLARIPVIPALKNLPQNESSTNRIRQASLRSHERWERGPRWLVNHLEIDRLGSQPKRIILVDDLLTTGATLLAAAQALQQVGYTEISAWVFGFRPSVSGNASRQSAQTCSSARPAP